MRYGEVYSVVAAIPLGKVATYGQVAALAGLHGRARLVGYALAALSDKTVPWHRVINSKGEISARTDGGPGAFVQRLRLEAEGVVFDEKGRVPLSQYQWRPFPAEALS